MLGNGISAAAGLLPRNQPISAPATTSAAMRGTRSRRTAASASSSARKKSSAVMPSGEISSGLSAGKSVAGSGLARRRSAE